MSLSVAATLCLIVKKNEKQDMGYCVEDAEFGVPMEAAVRIPGYNGRICGRYAERLR